MKTSAIIQVRMNSTRLPGKALLPLAGKPCLWWTVTRACLADEIDDVIIATTAVSLINAENTAAVMQNVISAKM